MVVPGILPLAIIRGIAFEQRVLQCRDEKVNVVSDAPGIEGQYLPAGSFFGFDLFILAGAQTSFLYYNPTFGTYIIAQSLSTDALTDYFAPTDNLTEPSGNYIGVGSYVGNVAVVTDNPVDLTGYAAEAHVRRTEHLNAEIVLDLQAVFTNDVAGEITIPAISKADTLLLPFIGNFRWDLVLRDSGGERFGPFLKGPFPISDNITRP